MNLVELAQRIRSSRQEQKLTLEQVATRTGLTRSWLSKVENFRLTPSLPALGRIAEALGVPLADLVRDLEQKPSLVIVRRGERQVVQRDRPNSHIIYESLAHKRANRRMDPFMLTVPPGDTRKPLPHEGEEFLLVLEGIVSFVYGDETHALRAGDAIYFDGTTSHCVVNEHAKPAKVLCVFHESAV